MDSIANGKGEVYMNVDDKSKANPKESMKTVKPIQQIVSELIQQGINASIVQKPPGIQFY